MIDRIITNTNEVTDFLDSIMQQEDIEPGRGLVEEKWIQTVLRKYIQNDYPNGTITKKSSDNVYFKVSLTKKFRKQIITIIYYFDSLVSEDKNNKEKILKLSFDVALKKAEEWSKLEEEKTIVKNKEHKEQYKIDKKNEQKELLSLKDLEQTFNSLKGSKEDPRVLTKWFENLFIVLNRKLFKSRLRLPHIDLEEQVHGSSTVKGSWNERNRTLSMSLTLLNAEFINVKTTFIHEMCHQAVSEISKISREDPRDGDDVEGHGSEWVKWMKICDQSPDRYSKGVYSIDRDYSEFATSKRNMEQEYLNRGEKQFKTQTKKYELVKYIDNKLNWEIGMSCGNYKKGDNFGCDILFLRNTPVYHYFLFDKLWKVTPENLNRIDIDIPAMKKLVDEYLEKD